MGILSKSLLVAFEVANELYVAIASGVLGIVILVKHGFETHQSVKTLSVVMVTVASLCYIFRGSEKLKASKKKVVFITGCDSGLGFSLAQHAVDCGFTVVAGFLSLESKGSKEIRRLCAGAIIQIQLDITSTPSIQNAVQTLEHLFNQNPYYSLHAVVNNAGIMIFAEFEWLTEKLIEQQLDVNLLGTFKMTKALCPLMRHHKSRLITITSHCALANLPGLAVYGATKAALASWSDGLRVEMAKYGVNVLTFIPGSFAMESNIMGKQLTYVQEMHDGFSEEQHRFYSDYFKRYNMYLSFITPPTVPKKITNDKLYEVFESTLLDTHPKTVYKHESWRYMIYHFLFRFSPVIIRDYFIKKFMQMPEYRPQEHIIKDDITDNLDDIDM